MLWIDTFVLLRIEQFWLIVVAAIMAGICIGVKFDQILDLLFNLIEWIQAKWRLGRKEQS